MRLSVWMLPVVLGLAGAAQGAERYEPKPGTYAVATAESEWKNGAATVPVKLYYPKNLEEMKEPLPLILFSHGLGGSREGYAMWANEWASHGYLVLLPTHVGSDTSVLRGAIGEGRGLRAELATAANAQNAVRRCEDISFCIDQMEKAEAGTLKDARLPELKGKVDLHHIGMAGHSFGAQTTLSIAGELWAGRKSMADPRVTAAIAMSPQPAALGDQSRAFGSIRIPVFHITGTADDSPIGDTKAADRRIPFDNMAGPPPDAFLVIYKGAVHMTFAPLGSAAGPGERLRHAAEPAGTEAVRKWVCESTTAFWDAYLKNAPGAKGWLATDFAKELGAGGTFEAKTK